MRPVRGGLAHARSPEVVLLPNKDRWNPDRHPEACIDDDDAIAREEAIASVESRDGRVDVVDDVSIAEARQHGADGAVRPQRAGLALERRGPAPRRRRGGRPRHARRRAVMPGLEFFDRAGFTTRRADGRALRPDRVGIFEGGPA